MPRGWSFEKKTATNAYNKLRTSGYTTQMTKGRGVDPTQGHPGEMRSCWTIRTTTSLREEDEGLFQTLGLLQKHS